MKLYEEQELTMQVFSEPEMTQNDVVNNPAVSGIPIGPVQCHLEHE